MGSAEVWIVPWLRLACRGDTGQKVLVIQAAIRCMLPARPVAKDYDYLLKSHARRLSSAEDREDKKLQVH